MSASATLSTTTTPEPEDQFGPPARRRSKLKGYLTVFGFMGPALVLFCLLVLAPIVLAAYDSFFKWNGYGGHPTDFVGLDNFKNLFQDEVFQGDLKRGGILILLSLVVQLPLSLGLAMLLNQNLRGRAIYRVLFFIPYVLSEVITAVLFNMVFASDIGLADKLFQAVGISTGTTWLADPNIVLFLLFFVITWKYFGLHMILYLAARQGIPKELHEAAATEGATAWQAFRKITLPLLGPTIRISIFLSVIGALQLFDLVWVLTGGGPVHASETMAVTMFQIGFRRHQIGYASALSIVMFLFSFIFAMLYQRFVLRRDTEGAITVLRDYR
jgi:raffinose/stachyose/melibiose transport system permease protein